MKKSILIIFGLFVSSTICGQSIERQVIGSAGIAVNNSAGDLSFTVGEVATASTNTGSSILTQGFQQAEEEDFTGIIEINDLNASATVFPNPSVDILRIESTLPSIGVEDLTYKVLDLQGRVIMEGSVASHEGSLDVSQLAASSYTLVLSSTDKNFIQRVKFSKI